MKPTRTQGHLAHTRPPWSSDGACECGSWIPAELEGGTMSKSDGYGSELATMAVFWLALAAAFGRGWIAALAILVLGLPAVKVVSLLVATSVGKPMQPADRELAAARVRHRLESEPEIAARAAA